MDPNLLNYYNQELQHLRDMGGEFATAYPKIANRLSLEKFDVTDPYVERLLEGFAFLSARVHLQLEAEFPKFTQYLLESVYPHYLAPTPSMTIVEFKPDLGQGSLASGFTIDRQSELRSLLEKGEQTPCVFRTAHNVCLWPVVLDEARYILSGGDLPDVRLPDGSKIRSAIRFRLRTTAGLKFSELENFDALTLHIRGSGRLTTQIYELLIANGVGVVSSPVDRPVPWMEINERAAIKRVGYADDEALLPPTARTFSGYRLLQEYFSFPERYFFVELSGLAAAARRCDSDQLEVTVLLNSRDGTLERAVDASQFSLNCTPAINLFPRQTDRAHISTTKNEHHLVVDRTRSIDFEVFQVNRVIGFGSGNEDRQEFLPFYSAREKAGHDATGAYFALNRVQRMPSTRQLRTGKRSKYSGSEVYVSLVDGHAAPHRQSLNQIEAETLCTNRDLPILVASSIGRGGEQGSDFTMVDSAPVDSVKVVTEPTRPRVSMAHGETAWRLVSHLSLNYLSISEGSAAQGAGVLRELLSLYGDIQAAHIQRQIEGVLNVESKPIVRRVPGGGPIAVARGMEIKTTFDESSFEGVGVVVLGGVLDEFFARHVGINSFTETVIAGNDRGEIARWPARIGKRQML